MGGQHLNKPIVAMAATPDGGGYWLVASDGGIFSYGDAQFYGSTGGIPLNKPIVGMAATPDGGATGWCVRRRHLRLRRRGLLRLHGRASTLNLPSSAWRPGSAAGATGWWPPTAASSTSAAPTSTAVGGHASSTSPWWGWPLTPDGGGYWLVASDGGIFNYGDALFYGSTGAITLNKPIVGMSSA